MNGNELKHYLHLWTALWATIIIDYDHDETVNELEWWYYALKWVMVINEWYGENDACISL